MQKLQLPEVLCAYFDVESCAHQVQKTIPFTFRHWSNQVRVFGFLRRLLGITNGQKYRTVDDIQSYKRTSNHLNKAASNILNRTIGSAKKDPGYIVIKFDDIRSTHWPPPQRNEFTCQLNITWSPSPNLTTHVYILLHILFAIALLTAWKPLLAHVHKFS